MDDSRRFERFRSIVLADVELQERLRGVTDWRAFVAAALVEAEAHGVELTAADLETGRRIAARSWLDRWV